MFLEDNVLLLMQKMILSLLGFGNIRSEPTVQVEMGAGASHKWARTRRASWS